MGLLTLICDNSAVANAADAPHAFTLRMPKALPAARVRLVQYGLETYTAQRGIRVDVSWLSGPTQTLTSEASGTAGTDHHIVLACHSGTGVYSLGDGIPFTPTNEIIQPVMTVRLYDLAGAPLAVKHLTLSFAHEAATTI